MFPGSHILKVAWAPLLQEADITGGMKSSRIASQASVLGSGLSSKGLSWEQAGRGVGGRLAHGEGPAEHVERDQQMVGQQAVLPYPIPYLGSGPS